MTNCFTHTYTGQKLPKRGVKYVPQIVEPCKTGKRAARLIAFMPAACQTVIMTPEESRRTNNVRYARI